VSAKYSDVPLVTLSEAQELVLGACEPLAPELLPISAAYRHVLAAPVVAPEDVPRFDNTAMDGFALRAADTVGGEASLSVIGVRAAGESAYVEVGSGQALRIMTGAPMPAGADAVVMIELTSPAPDGKSVTVRAEAAPGQNVRLAGSDLRSGTLVFGAGTELGAGHLGVLASIGASEVLVHRRPKVGLFSTGDELVAYSDTPRDGQIRDANRPALAACLVRDGFALLDLGILPDEEDAVRAGLQSGVSACDVLLTSGGVSAGDFDYVKVVLAELAGSAGFSRDLSVAIRPAKPLSFAIVETETASGDALRRVPVLGLPGNPVSSLVSYELFARPALRKMAGYLEPRRRAVTGVAGEDLRRSPDGKLHLERVVVHHDRGGRLVASASGTRPQSSHQLSAMASANALAMLPDGHGVSQGDEVDLLVLDWP
jgi:molybdopterin molybdotransferase